jgi:selenocysteine-specific elongation factor
LVAFGLIYICDESILTCHLVYAVRSLSTVLSTAALDKHPQSKERGITLDLGFSAFNLEVPAERRVEFGKYSLLQFTLVDCPGHASLIKTIIGGAQIIDMVSVSLCTPHM